jgi:type II secretory ATPase GspE/PulE/Tfp pilus assembly ATPase PilB-like protein
LEVSDELKSAITERAPVKKLRDLARSNGAYTLRDGAIDALQRGVTTLEDAIKAATLR